MKEPKMDDSESHGGLADTLRGRTSRRQVLKGGAAVGAAVVWAVPVVEVLTTASASASGVPAASYTFPSWAYVIYTTATDAAGLGASSVFSAGFTYPGDQGNAANPNNTQTGSFTSPELDEIGLSIAEAAPGPAPVTVSPSGSSSFPATSTTGSAPLQESNNLISPSTGSTITILGAFAFSGNYASIGGSKLIFVAAVGNQVQLPTA